MFTIKLKMNWMQVRALDPCKYVDPYKADVFNICYLLLKLITLNQVTDYQLLTVIPQLPDTYTSDPNLKSFLQLLIDGLSYSSKDRPRIYHLKVHRFLHAADNRDPVTSYDD